MQKVFQYALLFMIANFLSSSFNYIEYNGVNPDVTGIQLIGAILVFILVWGLKIVPGILFYEFILKPLIKIEGLAFKRESLIVIEVKGSPNSIFDSLIRMNHQLKIQVEDVNFDKMEILGLYQSDMGLKNVHFWNIYKKSKIKNGILEYFYKVKIKDKKNFIEVKIRKENFILSVMKFIGLFHAGTTTEKLHSESVNLIKESLLKEFNYEND